MAKEDGTYKQGLKRLNWEDTTPVPNKRWKADDDDDDDTEEEVSTPPPGPSSTPCHHTLLTPPTNCPTELGWSEMWADMVQRDARYTRDPNHLRRHPSLQARMRTILLDWLSEVCEVYKLHRDTYYLGQDLVDRYLSVNVDTPKNHLQLVGVTSLFIAAKIEEIYPPKLMDFAYVTDGACSEDQIQVKELVILKALKWQLNPVTINNWLKTYLQLLASPSSPHHPSGLLSVISQPTYLLAGQILDVCILDIHSLRFPYKVLAASAIYHVTENKEILRISGLGWRELRPCLEWMQLFTEVVLERHNSSHPPQPSNPDIQTHMMDIKMLDKVAKLQQQQQQSAKTITSSSLESDQISAELQALTPPSSQDV